MTQVRVCDQCGAKIEIEDTDDLQPISEMFNLEEETLPEVTLCENCETSQHTDQ